MNVNRYDQAASIQKYAAAAAVPQSIKQDTVTSLGNDLADAIVALRGDITNLRAELTAVCMPVPTPDKAGQSAAPQHSLLALAQLQALIEQVKGAQQDVRDMLAGLRI